MESSTNSRLPAVKPINGVAGALKERTQAAPCAEAAARAHVLVPIRLDCSAEELQSVLELAASLRPGACVTLLHVLPTPAPVERSFHWLDAIEQLHRALARQQIPVINQARQTILQRLEQDVRVELRNSLTLAAECRVGEVAVEIARFANEQSVDLVLLCNERGGWRWPLWPRLSERVLRLTSKPVILLHPPAKQVALLPN